MSKYFFSFLTVNLDLILPRNALGAFLRCCTVFPQMDGYVERFRRIAEERYSSCV
jgi:hypothetical protein